MTLSGPLAKQFSTAVVACLLLGPGALAQGPTPGWNKRNLSNPIDHGYEFRRTYTFWYDPANPYDVDTFAFRAFSEEVGVGNGYDNIKFEYQEPNNSLFYNEYHEWQWRAQAQAGEQPDYANFPMPQLYVLGRLKLDFNFQALYPPQYAGLNWQIRADNWSADNTITGAPYQASGSLPSSPMPSTLTRRALLQANANSLAQASWLELNPVFSFFVAANLFGPPGFVNYTSTRDALAVSLAQPDPFVRPDVTAIRRSEDNQHVYPGNVPGDDPNCIVQVPARIVAPGATPADYRFLLRIDPASSNDLASSANNSNVWLNVEHVASPGQSGSAADAGVRAFQLLRTEGSGIEPRTAYLGEELNQIVFSGAPLENRQWGMPSENRLFGTFSPTLVVRQPGPTGTVLRSSQRAYVQTFFPANAFNHPYPDGTPNWYFYYSQVYNPEGLFYEPTINVGGVPVVGFAEGSYPYRIFVADVNGERGSFFKVPVFRRNPANNREVVVADPRRLDVFGIHKYLHVVGHEEGHRHYFRNVLFSGGLDSDNDGLSDAFEIRNGLRADRPDSTGAYTENSSTFVRPSGPGTPDSELLADVYSLQVLQQNEAKWQNDWADTGLQYGQAQNPFPWNYGGSGVVPWNNVLKGPVFTGVRYSNPAQPF